jgi:hypothetical protein
MTLVRPAYGSKFYLVCPECGEEYLHQRRVTVWDRLEDAPMVRETTVSVAVSTMMADSHLTANPSERRQGMSIFFECETCLEGEEMHELCIAQHKGSTFVFWRGYQ